MINFIATEQTWVVITSKSPADLICVDEGLQFTSGQECEMFTDEVLATARATELGWIPPETISDRMFSQVYP